MTFGKKEFSPRVLVAARALAILAPVSMEGRSHASNRAKALFLVAGTGRPYEIDGRRVDLNVDTVLLINQLVEHRPMAMRSAEGSLVLSLSLGADSRHAEQSGDRVFSADSAPMDAPIRARLRRLTGLLGGAQSSDSGLLEAVMDLVACVVDTHATGSSARSRLAFDFRIRRAIQVVTADPKTAATVEDMLAASELSRSRFFELFRDCVGTTPQAFLDARIGDIAIAALVDSDLSIARVAKDIGFANPDAFTRLVRRATGLTPRDFRRAAIRL